MRFKKNCLSYFALLIILMPFIYPLITNTYYITADFRIQIIRFWSIIINFEAADYTAYWSNLIYNGYGSPMFLFYPPFYFYLLWLLYKSGVDFFVCFQVLNIAGFILSSFTMFIFANNYFSKKTAITIGFIYAVSSYHLYTIYKSGQFVEAFVWFYIPLLFNLIYKYFQSNNHKYFFYLSLFFGIFMVTHHSTIVIIIVPIIIYVLFLTINNQKKNIGLFVFFSLITAVLLSAYFTFPCYLEKESVLFGIRPTHDFRNNFRSIKDILFFFKVKENSNPLTMPLSVNFAALILSLISICAIILKKNLKKAYGAFLLILIFGLFFSLNISKGIWESIKTLEYLETPDRFLIIVSFALPLTAGIILDKIQHIHIKNILIFLIIIATYLQLKDHIKVYSIKAEQFVYLNKYFNNFDIDNFNPDTIKKFEYYTTEDYLLLPVIFNYEKFIKPVENRFIVSDGKITLLSESAAEITALIETQETADVIVNIPYFSGWQVYINDVKEKITRTNDGLISFNISEGAHNIKLRFELTLLRKIAVLISILTFAFLIIGLAIISFRK